MKTYFKYFSALVLASLVFAGCEKFLDTVSYTESNTSNYPASQQDAMQLVTGIYAALNQASYEPSAHSFIANLTMSDECFGGGGQDDRLQPADQTGGLDFRAAAAAEGEL